jgi:23S rRNA (guanosine2251-2'-O)-methyltransferase
MSDLIFGRNPVTEAIKSGREINHLLVQEGLRHGTLKRLVGEAIAAGITVKDTVKSKLDQLAGGDNHQGIAASIAAHGYMKLETLFQLIEDSEEPALVVVLDEIEDPHNLGSILRCAECTGAHAVIIPTRRACQLTSSVAKASAGAIEYVPVVRVDNLATTLRDLKNYGLWIVGTDAGGDKMLTEADLKQPTALVIGSEGKGLRPVIRKECDFVISIPMRGKVNSLNASVATGICLFEAMNQRTKVQ